MAFYVSIFSHSHAGCFPFLPIPIPEQSFNRCGINNFGLSDLDCALLVIESISNLRKAHVTPDSGGSITCKSCTACNKIILSFEEVFNVEVFIWKTPWM